jgi:hypothetical protein
MRLDLVVGLTLLFFSQLSIARSAMAQSPPKEPAQVDAGDTTPIVELAEEPSPPSQGADPSQSRPNATAAPVAAPPTATAPAPANWDYIPPDRDEPPPPVKRPRHWYGWQTLIVDGIAGVIITTGVATESLNTVRAGGLTYGLGPPIVHWGHGRVGRGFGSFGIRFIMPFLGALISTGAGGCSRTENCWNRTVDIGLGAGMVGAAAIDAAFIAWEPRPSRYAGEPEPSRALALSPAVSVTNSALSFDLRGRW